MKVSTATLFMIAVQIAAGFLLPAALGLYLRKKQGCRPLPFFIGCGVFFLFVTVLESLVHLLVLQLSPAGAAIQSHTWLYALYGGCMAGLFEESGRYLAFRTLLRRAQGDDKTALMYGAGHGGFECFYLLVTLGISNLVIALLINSGNTDLLTAQLGGGAEALAQLDALTAQLTQTAPWVFLSGILERCSAMCVHLSLSVLVWFAAKDGLRKIGLFPLAILLHAALDAVTVLLAGVLPAPLLELVILLIAAGYALLARLVWRKYAVPKEISA